MRRGRVGWRAFVLATAGLLAAILPASAQTARDGRSSAPRPPDVATRAENGPTWATFEGHRIDLASGWEQAKACVVLRHAGLVECFRSLVDAQAKAATVMPQSAASPFSCSSPLRLFEHSNYGGRQLMFFDRGYWQNLPDYGFNDEMSSYIVGACYSYLAEHIGGAGAFYPGPTSAWSGVPWLLSGWDNRVSSIYMA